MIDTTGWKIKVSPEQVNKIRRRSKEISKYDHDSDTSIFKFINDNIYVGSYNSSIILKCNDEDEVYIEFSVPKQYLGNNVELLYPSQLEQALAGIHKSLVDRFGDFPHYMTWKLQRLDLCYSWRLASQDEAAEALEILKTFDYPRKFKFLFPESVMWKGRAYSVKFYLKHPEFIRHDRKKLIESGIDL